MLGLADMQETLGATQNLVRGHTVAAMHAGFSVAGIKYDRDTGRKLLLLLLLAGPMVEITKSFPEACSYFGT